MIIYFDIETISDGENINEFDHDKLFERYGEKLNFMPEFNRIFTIAVWTVTKEGNIIKNLQGGEKEQIEAFFKAIEGNVIAGFNIKGFDLPFIIKRALKHQLDIPDCIKFFWKKPREMDNIVDLQEVYKQGQFGAFWKLDLICNYLWFNSPKDDNIDGSQVQAFYDAGKLEEVKEYCKRDVEATIKVYQYFVEYNLI